MAWNIKGVNLCENESLGQLNYFQVRCTNITGIGAREIS